MNQNYSYSPPPQSQSPVAVEITVRLETERLSLSRLLQRGRPSEGRPQNGSHSSELSSGISDHCSPTGGTRDGIARHER